MDGWKASFHPRRPTSFNICNGPESRLILGGDINFSMVPMTDNQHFFVEYLFTLQNKVQQFQI
jgi:hypothetical protein